MLNMSITIDSKKFEHYLRKAPAKLAKARKDSLQQSALKVQNRAKVLSPVLTGTLRRSITHKIIRDMAHVGTDVEYAVVQEYQNKSKPYGYLRPALTENKNAIQKIFEKNYKKAIQ